MEYECRFCGGVTGDHCPYCKACDYDNGDCSNQYCEADLID